MRPLRGFFLLFVSLTVFAGEPVARYRGGVVTSDELECAAEAELLRVKTELYDLEKAALDHLAGEQLIAKHAAAAGMSPREWLEREIARRVRPVTEDEVRRAFKSASGEIKRLPESDGLVRLATAMSVARRQEAERFVMQDVRASADVRMTIGPPRLAVDGGTVVHGAGDTAVTITLFTDFECPFSARFFPALLEIRERYPMRVRIIQFDSPLPRHANAPRAAEAAACAEEQDHFWEMSRRMYANQKKLGFDDLVHHAEEMGLDRRQFETCLAAGRYARMWQDGRKAAERYAIRGTPTVFVNGRLVLDHTFAALSRIIEEELSIDR